VELELLLVELELLLVLVELEPLLVELVLLVLVELELEPLLVELVLLLVLVLVLVELELLLVELELVLELLLDELLPSFSSKGSSLRAPQPPAVASESAPAIAIFFHVVVRMVLWRDERTRRIDGAAGG
jgi:hypothetical protein